MGRIRSQLTRAIALLTLAALCVSVAFLARSASGAFPGKNGKIAFVREVSGCNFSDPQSNCNFDIFTMRPDGSHQLRITHDHASEFSPAFSADGRKIAFDRKGEIWVMDADGSHQRRLTHNQAFD